MVIEFGSSYFPILPLLQGGGVLLRDVLVLWGGFLDVGFLVDSELQTALSMGCMLMLKVAHSRRAICRWVLTQT